MSTLTILLVIFLFAGLTIFVVFFCACVAASNADKWEEASLREENHPQLRVSVDKKVVQSVSYDRANEYV
jgi:heme/copper-type cytochrome/quinol oxidase subunit 3